MSGIQEAELADTIKILVDDFVMGRQLPEPSKLIEASLADDNPFLQESATFISNLRSCVDLKKHVRDDQLI